MKFKVFWKKFIGSVYFQPLFYCFFAYLATVFWLHGLAFTWTIGTSSGSKSYLVPTIS